MADERIDIEVTDKGSEQAANNLRRLADEADRGYNYVRKLQGALKSINAGETLKLAAAATNHTNALARQAAAQAKVTAATANASVATAKAATEQQRLATETSRTAAAMARATVAENAAARSALQLAAANDRAAASKGNLFNRANALKSALDPAYAAQMRFNAEINEANALLAAGAIKMGTYQQAVAAADARLKAVGTTMGATNAVGGRLRGQTANIAAQMNDLGVQFAMAAQSGNPLQMVFMALIQQGSQLSYIASTMEGGWKAMGAQMLGMVARFWPLIVAIGAAVAAFKLFQNEMNNDGAAKKYAATLGLTKKEMAELKDVTITAGDMMSGLWKTISDRTGVDEALSAMKSFFYDTFKSILNFAVDAVAAIYAAFVGTYRAVTNHWRNFPGMLHGVFITAVNLAITVLEKLANNAASILNGLAKGMNAVFGTEIGQIADIQLPRLAAAAGSTAAQVAAEYTGAFNEARSGMRGFYDDWQKNSEDAMKKRLRGQANEIIEGRGAGPRGARPKVDRTAENRAHALNMVNLELDKELARMRLLKDERAIQQRMDQIEESLAQKKIKLNDAERASIRAKVTEIERFKYVQAEMDRITEDADAPRRTLNASLEAANLLLQQGAIDQERYNVEMTKANRLYQEATDPLFQMKEALDAQTRTLGLYGVELEKANYLEEVRLAYLAKGIDLATQSSAAIRGEVAALVAKNDALRQQQFIQSQVAAIVNPIVEQDREVMARAAVYAELERLRSIDYINEKQHQQAKAQLWMQANATNLGIVADGFGAIADATAKGHGVIGAISKAAAVAQAVIQGYVAVQNALATVPYPFNYVAAAAVAVKTGTQVAGILSTNVGSYATGGQFIVGGRSGVDKNNINMNVTKGERVTIETAKQQRANDNGPGMPEVNANTKVVNLFDERSFIGAMDSDEGERVVMNIIRRNSDGILAMSAQ